MGLHFVNSRAPSSHPSLLQIPPNQQLLLPLLDVVLLREIIVSIRLWKLPNPAGPGVELRFLRGVRQEILAEFFKRSVHACLPLFLRDTDGIRRKDQDRGFPLSINMAVFNHSKCTLLDRRLR